MNQVILKGIIQNIEPSHKIGLVEYYKANLIVPNAHKNDSDTIIIKFKKFNNRFNDGDYAEISGNLRSFSEKLPDGKNKVSIYVFTYQDLIDGKTPTEIKNSVEIDGRICKKDAVRVTANGKQTTHAILANNIITEETNQKVNSYIPIVAWGKTAIKLDELEVNDKVKILGEVHSRAYKKYLDNGEIEIRVAHELLVADIEKVEE